MRAFLDRNGWDLPALRLSSISDLGTFQTHRRIYVVAAPPAEVWEAYASAAPLAAWGTALTRFGVAWDPVSARLYTSGDASVPSFAVHQIYVLEVRVAGFLRIPAAFEITRLDPRERRIEFVYLEDNVSNGLQRLYFTGLRDAEGRAFTMIEHVTWYRSGRAFRDRRLYARFHARIIDAFHESILNVRALAYEIRDAY